MAKLTDQPVGQDCFHLSLHAAAHGTWTPNTDVYETPDQIVVRMEVAGVEAGSLELTLTERLLVVRGSRPDPCRVGRCQFRQMEIDYGAFERRIVVPCAVDGAQARAVLGNGFLQIDLPKRAGAALTTVSIVIVPSGC